MLLLPLARTVPYSQCLSCRITQIFICLRYKPLIFFIFSLVHFSTGQGLLVKEVLMGSCLPKTIFLPPLCRSNSFPPKQSGPLTLASTRAPFYAYWFMDTWNQMTRGSFSYNLLNPWSCLLVKEFLSLTSGPPNTVNLRL
jgi:hypothetical protein